MNIIKSVQIDNLWGSYGIAFTCDEKFNFLIGQNGTGKTTVINLIAAVLTADFEKLDKTEFDRAVITFKSRIGKNKPSIEVKKQKKKICHFAILVMNLNKLKRIVILLNLFSVKWIKKCFFDEV
jgi:recombinational DNA repair ATPase RecF